ncbi:MAG: EVE domain-containing protein [Chloroflexi bacterium]|nr:EVE domain-containing protein [Chloroflexota bacterium]
MPAWLLKTEPHHYSLVDLERDGVTPWDGVRNAQARINLRAMQVDDVGVIYHSGDERAAVGLARVTRAAYPDPEQPNENAPVVDVAFVERLATPVALAALKAHVVFADSPLVRQTRLSVLPLTPEQLALIRQLGSQ